MIGNFGSGETSFISNSYSDVDIYTNAEKVGGLVGIMDGILSNSYATGNVKGSDSVGGLVGHTGFYSEITNCYSVGNVTGYDKVGGLVGSSRGLLNNSYATGNVTGNDYVGGLLGYTTERTISNCYAAGNVTGKNYVGGLMGSCGAVDNCDASGDVQGETSVGGLIGTMSGFLISNSYSKGKVNGSSMVGGLVGSVVRTSNSTSTISNCVSYSDVRGDNAGILIGGFTCTADEVTYGRLQLNDVSAVSQNLNIIGGAYKSDGSVLNNYDLSSYESVATTFVIPTTLISLQIGTKSDSNSQIVFDTVAYGLIDSLEGLQMEDANSLKVIDNVINSLSAKQVEYGAAINRVESALDEINIQYENLVSSRSTIRDADVAKVSASYIQQQILQQASATLLATANQSPSIALQLI